MNNPNWSSILLYLRTHYVHNQSLRSDGLKKGMAVIAKLVNSDAHTLNRIIRHEVKEPKYSVGINILKLYNETRSKNEA